MKPIKVYVKFDGSGTKDGAIDAAILGASLSSFAVLVEAAKVEYAGDSVPKIDVRIRSDFDAACFEFSMGLAQSPYGEMKNLFTGKRLTFVRELIEWLGLIGDGTSLTWLLRKLKNKRVHKADACENGLALEMGDGERIVVPESIWRAHQNGKIRKALKTILHDGMNGTGIESVAIGCEASEAQVFTDAEKHLFDYRPRATLEFENTVEKTVQIVKLSFGENQKWTLTDGERHFNALITDRAFLAKVRGGEEEFRAEDRLRVSLRETQTSEGAKLKSEYKVEKVYAHERSPQLKIFNPVSGERRGTSSGRSRFIK